MRSPKNRPLVPCPLRFPICSACKNFTTPAEQAAYGSLCEGCFAGLQHEACGSEPIAADAPKRIEPHIRRYRSSATLPMAQ